MSEEKTKTEIIENLSFSFSPEFEIQEGDSKSEWVRIGGVALTEGTSRNNNVYTISNLKENDGTKFKWLFGHPDEPEEHVIGMGELRLEGDKLFHEGKIRNTAKHPDVIESVKDGFLGPSIHATASKVERKNGQYFIEGLSIDGIGLVAFQGVKGATIDYAIAESFDKVELKESSLEDENNNEDKEDDNMSEETIPKLAEEPVVESSVVQELEAAKKELALIKESKKKELVESIIAINKELKQEELMKESEDKLELIKAYETKLSSKTESVAVVESDEEEEAEEVEESRGCVTITKEAYDKFNKELRARIR